MPEKEQIKPVTRIDAYSIEAIQYKASTYRTDISVEMSVDDLLKPEVWINAKRKFPQITVGDTIQCLKEDISRFIELFVIGTTNDTLFLKVLRDIDLNDNKEPKSNSPYEIKFLGPVKKHTIIRKSDGEELRSGISSKSEAEKWIKDNT